MDQTYASAPSPAGADASDQASRRAVLSHLFEHLQSAYGIDSLQGKAAELPKGRQGIEALLAFRTDPTLDELHNALIRLDEGTFGICIACKHRIGQGLMLADPGRRLCPDCETAFFPHPAAGR